jgi:hypothetical protein
MCRIIAKFLDCSENFNLGRTKRTMAVHITPKILETNETTCHLSYFSETAKIKAKNMSRRVSELTILKNSSKLCKFYCFEYTCHHTERILDPNFTRVDNRDFRINFHIRKPIKLTYCCYQCLVGAVNLKLPMVPGFGELTSETVMTAVEQVIYRHSTVDYTKSEKAQSEQAKVYLPDNVCVNLLRVIKMIQMIYIFEKNIDSWKPVREPHHFDKAFLDPPTHYLVTHAQRQGLFNTIDDVLVMDTVITLIKKLLEYNLITRDQYRDLPYKTLSQSQLEEDEICPICHMEFGDGDLKCNNPIVLRCAGKRRGHKFGFGCIKAWRSSVIQADRRTPLSCPTCRRRVNGSRTVDWPWEQLQVQFKDPETPAWVELLIPDIFRHTEKSDCLK